MSGRMQLTVTLPMRLVNELNARTHWSIRHRRNAEQRGLIRMTLASQAVWPLKLPVEVHIVRIGPRRLDSHDGLCASAKPVVDGVAVALGVDDADPRVRWSYGQRSAGKAMFAVEVTVREVDPT